MLLKLRLNRMFCLLIKHFNTEFINFNMFLQVSSVNAVDITCSSCSKNAYIEWKVLQVMAYTMYFSLHSQQVLFSSLIKFYWVE